MQLARFVADNANCEVGRPDWATPLFATVAASLAASISLYAAYDGSTTGADGAALIWLLLGLGLLYPAFVAARAAVKVGAIVRRGRSCWAISDSDLLLVDPDGAVIVVALDRIVDVTFSEGEVRVRTDSELQGVLYAFLFRVFDDELPCPSAEHLYEALSARLPEPRPLGTSEHPARAAA
ncbi:MAG: hypothetical protein RIF41_22055 [Polyangiaceae bacterium]